MATMAETLDELQSDPQGFLRHYVVTIAIAGMTSGTVPQRRTTFLMEPGNEPAFRGFQTGLSGLAGRDKSRPRLRIRTFDRGAAAEPGKFVFDAWCIPMSEKDDGPLARHVLLPGSGGPDIALTSQMSGCTFGIGSPGRDGSRFVSHVRPPAGRQEASLGDMEAFFDRGSRVGSRSYANRENYATVIGIRQDGNWRFYAQTYNLGDRRLFKVEALNG